MNDKNVRPNDPVNRFVEKEKEIEELSPMNPPDAFSPSTVEPVAYEDMNVFI
jgi:hypothetical protein